MLDFHTFFSAVKWILNKKMFMFILNLNIFKFSFSNVFCWSPFQYLPMIQGSFEDCSCNNVGPKLPEENATPLRWYIHALSLLNWRIWMGGSPINRGAWNCLPSALRSGDYLPLLMLFFLLMICCLKSVC